MNQRSGPKEQNDQQSGDGIGPEYELQIDQHAAGIIGQKEKATPWMMLISVSSIFTTNPSNSDFGLNDAIESGLVKTPRVVVRDDGVPDAKTFKSKLYHIYEHVKDDLNHKAEEQVPLPDLVTVGYYLLGKDWLEAAKAWKKAGLRTPPVMITVAERRRRHG